MTPHQSTLDLKKRIGESIIGQTEVVERLLLTLLCNGNLLMEGMPGLAKTRSIKSLARNLEADFSRIQFTPDLLPSDVTGSEVYHSDAKGSVFRFQQGPIFANLVLADEINRAPAKVQSSLLEAMEERQVTVAGQTHQLPELFMVLATQNPVEQEGTYPLPEAQMDRFLMHVNVDYPTPEEEIQIMRLVRGEQSGQAAEEKTKIPSQAIFDARREIGKIHVSENIERYIADLVHATRNPANYGENLSQWVELGASPRGALALEKVSRAHAWLRGRDHVTPDDVKAIAPDCLRHRLTLTYQANAEGITAQKAVEELLTQVAVV